MNHLTRVPRRGWNLASDLESMLEGFLDPARQFSPAEGLLTPAMDVVETQDGYVVKADLPGVSKDDLHVSVKDNVLTVEAQTSTERDEKEGEAIIRTERSIGKYRRVLRLGLVDESAITAVYRDGVLTVTLPHGDEDKGRKIEVAVH